MLLRITSYNVCYTKLLRTALSVELGLVVPEDPVEVEDQIETPVEEVEKEPTDLLPVEDDSTDEEEPENVLEPLDPVDEAEFEIPQETMPSDFV